MQDTAPRPLFRRPILHADSRPLLRQPCRRSSSCTRVIDRASLSAAALERLQAPSPAPLTAAFLSHRKTVMIAFFPPLRGPLRRPLRRPLCRRLASAAASASSSALAVVRCVVVRHAPFSRPVRARGGTTAEWRAAAAAPRTRRAAEQRQNTGRTFKFWRAMTSHQWPRGQVRTASARG